MGWLRVAGVAAMAAVAAVALVPAPSRAGLRGKVVVVTGASHGIGNDVAMQFAAAGARVLVTARNATLLAATRIALLEAGAAEAWDIAADLSSQADAERFWADAERLTAGETELLVLNHVLGYYAQPLNSSPGEMREILDRLMSVNTLAYAHVALLALPALERNRGGIVVVSSMAGKMGLPMTAPYAATKHALHGFFDGLRQDLTGRGSAVTVSTAVLGNIDTESNRRATEGLLPDHVVRHPSSGAAAVIVDASITRCREVYYPWVEIVPLLTLRAFVPTTVDWIVRQALAT